MSSEDVSQKPVAIVTGASGGLGLVISQTLASQDYRVILVGRNRERLHEARQRLSGQNHAAIVGDVTNQADVTRLFAEVHAQCGRLDVLVNCVGTSDRGLIENLSTEKLDELIQQNVLTALLCCQAAIPALEQSQGVIVNIGSLAAKVGARYIGGYAIAKHALAGMTQQLRLELKPRGIHVGLVNPGPIQRSDAGQRYRDSIDDRLPAQAAAPGGGARLKGLPPQRVADAVMGCISRRRPDVVLPRHLRLLIGIGHLIPRLGDWLLMKFTSSKDQ